VTAYFTMYYFRTRLGRATGFSLFMFALSFFPMSNILFPVGTLIAERLLYIPSLGYLLPLVCFFNAAWLYLTRKPTLSTSAKSLGMLVYFASIVALGAFYWVRCYLRIFDWADAETITEIDGLSQLKSGRTQFNLGNFYLGKKEYDKALVAYTR